MKDIGKNIKAIRKAKAMTQDELAEKLFVTRQTVSNYENGRSRPDVDTVIKLAEILETDTNSILYGLPQPVSKKFEFTVMIRNTALFLTLSILYIVLEISFFSKSDTYFQYILPKYLANMTLRPAIMFLLGWVLFSVIQFIGNWQLRNNRWLKAAKITLRIILVLLVVIPIPQLVFTVVSMVHAALYNGTSLSMQLIPVYREVMWFVLWLMMKHPLIYSVLGGLLRLVTPGISI